MQTNNGLRVEGRVEESSKLIKAINALPDGTIEGLSEYDPSDASLHKGKVIIKSQPGHSGPLTVNFPEGSTNNIASRTFASFKYKRIKYEIHY